MSEQPTRNYQRRITRRSTRVWIALSFAISGAILVWMASIPFRMSGSSLAGPKSAAAETETDSLDLASRLAKRRSDAEHYREIARDLDREFMAALAKKRAQREARLRDLPDTRDAKSYFVKLRTQRIEAIKNLGNPEEGSSEWGYLQELKNTDFNDAPE